MSLGEIPGRGVVGSRVNTYVTLLGIDAFCTAGAVAFCLPTSGVGVCLQPQQEVYCPLWALQASREDWHLTVAFPLVSLKSEIEHLYSDFSGPLA